MKVTGLTMMKGCTCETVKVKLMSSDGCSGDGCCDDAESWDSEDGDKMMDGSFGDAIK